MTAAPNNAHPQPGVIASSTAPARHPGRSRRALRWTRRSRMTSRARCHCAPRHCSGRLTCMISKPLLPPTMATLGSILPQYGEFRFDRTLEAARRDISDEADLAYPAHAVRLRKWLNQWTCRIGYPKAGEADVFVGSLARWWVDVKDMLPAEHLRLAQLADAQLQSVGHAYAELYRRPAAVSRAGTIRSVGPTAAASCSTLSARSRSPPGTRRSPPGPAGVMTKQPS